MYTVYMVCSIAGGTALILQTILTVIGMAETDSFDGGDADGFDPDQHHDFFRFLSVRTLIAFVTFFGLSGLACLDRDMAAGLTLLISTAAGTTALFLVYQLLVWMSDMESSGNVHLKNAIGVVAKVYLRIPANDEGEGKVTIPLQGRTLECRALTGGEGIATGSEARVTEVLGTRLVRVLPVEEEV